MGLNQVISFMYRGIWKRPEICRAEPEVNDARSSFRFRTADLIFLVYLESVTHNDNLDKFIVTKGNQAQGKVGACTNHPEGKLYKSTTG